jgi:hypothetical protein
MDLKGSKKRSYTKYLGREKKLNLEKGVELAE